MRFLLLLIAIALPLGYLFGEEEYTRFTRLKEISIAPGFAPAVFEQVIKTGGKKHQNYRVRYRYEVDGKQYRVTTTPTDEAGAMAYVAQTDMQIAYSKRTPAVGTIKRYYDLRRPGETLGQVLFITAILAFGLALPIALGVAWPLGWLRRK